MASAGGLSVPDKHASYAESGLSDKAGCSDRYVSHLIPLALLAPEIVESILAGTQPVDLTAETLIKRADLPLRWADQKALLGFD